MGYKIESTHTEYDMAYPNWKTVRALMAGERALKTADKESHSTFILKPCPEDTSTDNALRYDQYVDRASLFNFTKRTVAGMTGMVLQKPAIAEFPDITDYMLEDVDGSGLSIEQQANEVLTDVIEVGNCGLLVDYPKTTAPTTEADREKNGIRATINLYKVESIRDWNVTKVNAKRVLSYVKLMEIIDEVDPNDFYALKKKTQYRMLLLENGIYTQRLYDDKDNLIEDNIIPVDGSGNPFDYIPFFFVGSINNTPGIDVSPIQEIADLNIKHYRNSADWEESSYMVGQPSPVFAGLTDGWVKDIWKGGVKLGSRGGIPLPVGGSAMLLQAAPNTMPETGMRHKEDQAIALGARLISGGQAETAEAVYVRHSTDASVLKIIVMNINDAYKSALAAVGQFMSAPEEAEFSLNTEFVADKMSGDMITALVASWMQGAISKQVLDEKLRVGGVIPDDVDLGEMNNDIENGITGPNLGDM